MSLFIAAYDISHDGRRRRVARALERYGRRVQRSVFEVWLTPKELPRFRIEIGALLAKEDAFDIFPVDERGSRRRMRWQRPPTDYSPVRVLAPPGHTEPPWPPPGTRPLTEADWDTPDDFLEMTGSVVGGW